MCYVYAFVLAFLLFGESNRADEQLEETTKLLSVSLDSASLSLNEITVENLSADQKALYFYIKADIDFKTNHLLKSLISYLESLKYANEVGNRKLQHSMNKNIGKVFYYYNNHDLSIHFYQKSIEYTDIPDKIGRINYNLGISYYSKDDLESSIKHFKMALDLVESSRMKARVLNYLGIVYTDLKEYDLSNNSLKSCLSLKSDFSRAKVYHNLARNFQSFSQFDSAKFYYEQALKVDSREFITYLDLGDLIKDVEILKQAESLYSEQQLRFRNIKVFYLLGKLTGDTNYFDRYYEETKRFEEEREEALDILKSEYSEFIFDAYNRKAGNEDAKAQLLHYLLILAILIILILIFYPIIIKRRTANQVKRGIEQILNR